MLSERIEKLRQEYADQYVVVDSQQPQWARFADVLGRVKTVSFNGRALVQFEGPDRTWYDVELDYLKVVDRPQPKATEQEGQRVPAREPQQRQAEPAVETGPPEQLSRLELARLEKGLPGNAANSAKREPL
jgi:hypothetical protein